MHSPRITALAMASALVMAGSAQAGLVLTPAGIADGFSLSVFASGFPNGNTCGAPCGPFGTAVNSAGKVMVESYYNSASAGAPNIVIFNDVDGQTYSSPLSGPVAFPNATSYASAFARLGSTVYASSADTSDIVALNNDGTVNHHVLHSISRGGLAADTADGTLISATGSGLYENDPAGINPAHLIVGGAFDGASVSADGQTVFGAQGGCLYAFHKATGTPISHSPFCEGTADGAGVILGSNIFAGDLISNNNDGTVDLIDPVANTITLIANGGSRGDFVGFDPNGSLFLTQSDSIDRLVCTLANCFFSAPPPTRGVPEPATLALFGVGLAGLGALYRRRRARA